MRLSDRDRRLLPLLASLLLVLGIAVQAVILALAISNSETRAQLTPCAKEYLNVQTALNNYMSTNNVDSIVSTHASGTNDMTQPVALFNPDPHAGSPTYIQEPKTQDFYVWNSSGEITNVYSDTRFAPVPSSCKGVPGLTEH